MSLHEKTSILGNGDKRVAAKVNQKYMIVLFTITLLSALRYDVGADCMTYYRNFDYIVRNDYFGIASYEPGFIMLYQIVGYFFKDPQSIIVASSIIINILVGKKIYNTSPYPILSLYCYLSFYFYFISLNVIRQFVAISIVFYFMDYAFLKGIKNKLIFIIICLFASTFHSIGIFGLFYFLLSRFRHNMWVKMGTLLLAGTFVVTAKTFTSYLFTYLPSYELYADYGREGSSKTLIAILSMMLIISWFFQKKGDSYIKNYNLYQNLIAVGLLLNCLADANIMFSRFSYLFIINLIIIIPLLISKINTSNSSIVVAKLILIILSFSYCLLNLSINNGSVVPYHFCF